MDDRELRDQLRSHMAHLGPISDEQLDELVEASKASQKEWARLVAQQKDAPLPPVAARDPDDDRPTTPEAEAILKRLFRQSRPNRLDEFLKWAWSQERDDADDATYWAVVVHIWIDAEHCDLDTWGEFWLDASWYPAEMVMSVNERKRLASLPDRVAIYRGIAGQAWRGLSWTLDREKAEWFAQRFPHQGDPHVVTATVRRDKILALLDARRESEVIVNPDDLEVEVSQITPR